ncbi:C-C chemokine receptor type 2-like [Thalassophryne amazonica]|uniref:C-C chemokine receptor type 2-like n=1 Tax=Thalassophryne amazonica TaxID=390379 RepID=UPI0014718B9A|nr:C-C chemokine receptor type 2-like [Thalassophryne amazonica]
MMALNMTTTENTTFMYIYDIDYNDSSPEDVSSDLSNGSMVLPVILYILFFLGVLGNATVLWVLLRFMKMKTMTDICLLNLAVSDLILAVSLPLWAHNSQNLTSCKLKTGIYQLGLYSGTMLVTLMSVDRYLAIVHAVATMRTRTLCCGAVASLIIWIVSASLTIPLVIFVAVEFDQDNSSCQPVYPAESEQSWKKLRNFSENTVGLFLCLPIMIFCYVKILVVLHTSRNSNKDKAMKLIYTIVCVFVVCWVPYNILVFLETLQLFGILNSFEATKKISSAMGVAELIALSRCCINPVIYAFVGEKFRKSLCRMLSRYPCLKYKSSQPFSLRDTTEKETSNTPVRSDY